MLSLGGNYFNVSPSLSLSLPLYLFIYLYFSSIDFTGFYNIQLKKYIPDLCILENIPKSEDVFTNAAVLENFLDFARVF